MAKQPEQNGVIGVPEMKYPNQLELWEVNIPQSNRINFINAGDFHLSEVLAGIGVDKSPLASSFGITDTEEILARHELVAWLSGDKNRRNIISQMDVETELPDEQESFLKYYNPEVAHWPHWRRVHALLKLFDEGSPLPKRLEKFRDALRASLSLEECERATAAHIVGKLEGMLRVEGIAEVPLSLCVNESLVVNGRLSPYIIKAKEICESSVIGHQMYSQDVSVYDNVTYPDWMNKPWYKSWKVAFGIAAFKKWQFRRQVADKRKSAYKAMEIKDLSTVLKYDIATAIVKHVDSISKGRTPWPMFKRSMVLTAHVHFHYDEAGLKIQIFGIDCDPADKHGTGYGDYEWQSVTPRRDQKEELNLFSYDLYKAIRSRQSAEIGSRFFQMLRRWCPTIDKHLVPADSSETDAYHRWFALKNVYRTPEVAASVQELEKHRYFFYRHVNRLKEVAKLVNAQINAARKLGSPLTSPKLSQDGHLVKFNGIFPARLLARPDVDAYKEIKGIPVLNGQAICLTGAHAGGKTTTSFAVAENVFLAQSGLMVFGSGFTWNVKRYIGLVVSERGNGSKAELLLGKLRAVISALKQVNGREALLVFDELGTGTQEDAGLDLGKDVLKALANRGISLLFNTQIQDLARWAQGETNAVCLYVDSKRAWRPGISDGGLKQLRRTSGFNRELAELAKV